MSLPLTLDAAALRDLDRALRAEWLETNGLGGWAAGTVAGAHTRRYHGLLVAALHPPAERMVLLSKFEESILFKDTTYELGCNQYPGVIAPSGHRLLEQFDLRPFPTWRYRAGPLGLTRQIAAIHGENTTVVTYTLTEAPGPIELLLRPLAAVRGYHALQHANDQIHREAAFADGTLTVRAYDGAPPFYVHAPGARFDWTPYWYYRFQYREEQARGLDFEEDLFCHGVLRITLQPGESLGVTVALEPPAGRAAAALVAREAARRDAVVVAAGFTGEVERQLVRAADQFIVRRGAAERTIIAGYPWFADWGRDTMIALPGLCVATRRFAEARDILRAWAGHVDQGLLPNRFPDTGTQPEYLAADASLWFFVAVRAYLRDSGDAALVREELLPALEDIISWYDKGTRFHIKSQPDGLLFAGQPGVAVTWMDAKVGDWVVTPRSGLAVEINALWINALLILAELRGKCGRPDAAAPAARATAAQRRFGEVFWNERAGCLCDVVHGGDRDASVRPNQLFAISLPYELLPRDRALAVLGTVEQKLLTPVGLRSLAPGATGFCPRYEGGVRARDGAYHQGTVWGWLLGPYLTALVRLRGAAGRARAREMVDRLAALLGEAGLGTLSEIYDAEPPFTPRGCPAQAWSVSEILRVCREDLGA